MYLVALPLIWSEAEHDLVVMITKKFAFEKQQGFYHNKVILSCHSCSKVWQHTAVNGLLLTKSVNS